jgi:predicted Co/Zn/Cd cation transporter (cation efflux family)
MRDIEVLFILVAVLAFWSAIGLLISGDRGWRFAILYGLLAIFPLVLLIIAIVRRVSRQKAERLAKMRTDTELLAEMRAELRGLRDLRAEMRDKP